MDFGNGWHLTTDQWRQLHVIEWLYDHADGRPGQSVTTNHAELACALPGIGPASGESLRSTFDYLYREGLVRYPIPYLGEVTDVPVRAELTEVGSRLVQQLRLRRRDPAERRPAARDAVLRWLYEQAAAGIPSPMLWNFPEGSYARFLSATTLFTIAEINDAASWLHQNGYIIGTIEKPTITSDGERAVERGWPSGGDIAALGRTTITVTGSSGVNIASHSPGAAQTATVTITTEARQRLHNLAGYLDQTAGQLGLPPDTAATVPGLVDDLRSAADEPTAERKKLAGLLDTARLLAVGAASIPLGAGLQALTIQVAHALGL